MLNGGTRRQEAAEGDGSLDREIEGNKLAGSIARIIKALVSVGSGFSIENPKSSFLWYYKPIRELLDTYTQVDFYQCAYDLRVGGELVKKPTKLVTNVNTLSRLSRICSCQHKHLVCMGSIKTKQGTFKVSKLAGVYPQKLCRAWAGLVREWLSNEG